jgi:hypothetical protein
MPDRVKSHFETASRLFKSRASVFVLSMLLLAWLFFFAGMLVGPHIMALKSVDGENPRVSWASLGVLFLIAFLLNIAGIALVGIGLVISFPVSLLAIAGFYRSVQPATV